MHEVMSNAKMVVWPCKTFFYVCSCSCTCASKDMYNAMCKQISISEQLALVPKDMYLNKTDLEEEYVQDKVRPIMKHVI